MKLLKNIVLFFLSPFIALVYVVILPFLGLYTFLNLLVERILLIDIIPCFSRHIKKT